MALGNLLIVDDEELILEKLAILLEDIADEVYTAIKGDEALEILKTKEVHCVVCDINMPEMTGIEVIKKAREENCNIPFIFYTGHGSTEIMKEAAQYNAYDFVDKPRLQELEEIAEEGLKAGLAGNSDYAGSHTTDYRKMISEK